MIDEVAIATARRWTLYAVWKEGCWLMPDWEDSSPPTQANPLRRALTLRSARGIDGACMLVTGDDRHTSRFGEEGVGLTVNFYVRSEH